MAAPTQNHVGVSWVDPTSAGVGKYLIYGPKWGGGYGQGVTLTYSFPTGTAHYDADYSYYNEWGQWLSVTTAERAAVRDALATWSRFGNVRFQETPDNGTTVGELRFTYTKNIDATSAAHAYYPADYPAGGDVWFSWFDFNADGGAVPRGTYDFLAILHEVGHALGLKHPFEGGSIIPPAQNNFFYTIMSYTASRWSDTGDNWASFYPTTPMYYDLVAIQALYGRAQVNTGNNTYIFKDGSYYWQAINDSGGVDTIVYSGAESTRINLNPGSFSSLSEAIKFSGGRSSRDTVTIGPGVVIENATGGSGHDTLTGNTVANVLNGGAGNDTLNGGGGDDRLVGGVGADRMYGGAGNDTYYVDNAGDIVNESVSGSGGIDTILSPIGLSLADKVRVLGSVENLTLLGTTAVFGVGNGLNNVIVGNGIANSLEGGAGNDTLNGGLGNDTLGGGLGNDTLIGGTGADLMRGGAGDDIYHVDNAGDIVDESIVGSHGADTVQSVITFSLANAAKVRGAVENLTLLGNAVINGAGNSLANRIVGNAAANMLSGAAGNDTLLGGAGYDILDGSAGADRMCGEAGNDTYRIDNFADIVDESGAANGIDTVQSLISFSLANAARVLGSVENLTLLGNSAISGTGNNLANRIVGNASGNFLSGGAGGDTLLGGAGNDILDGGIGADRMRGEAGNDIYRVDNVADVVDESGGASNGTDTVQSLISFSLANAPSVFGSVENLTLLGSAAIDGTGNGLANVIIGNSAANILNGGGGADLLRGGGGNDVYGVDDAGDVVDEGLTGSGGIDTVVSTRSFNLGDAAHAMGAVENLTLIGAAAINGTGNGLANVLTGNSAANSLSGGGGNDVLDGGLGNDVLKGGAGQDIFLFNTALDNKNVDTISDFAAAEDNVQLASARFAGLTSLGTLASSAFVKNTSGLAEDADDRIIFQSGTGNLLYDADGLGGAAGINFARLSPGLDLSHTNFYVV